MVFVNILIVNVYKMCLQCIQNRRFSERTNTRTHERTHDRTHERIHEWTHERTQKRINKLTNSLMTIYNISSVSRVSVKHYSATQLWMIGKLVNSFILPCVKRMLAGGLADDWFRESLKPFGLAVGRRVKLRQHLTCIRWHISTVKYLAFEYVFEC